MWKILLLWFVPLAFGLVILVRLAEGSPPVSDEEWRLLFGDTREMAWSPWLALEFVALAVLFFIIGFFEGLVLVNFGPILLIAALLMTGFAAMFLLARCLRSHPREDRVVARDSAPSRAHDSHSAGLFSR